MAFYDPLRACVHCLVVYAGAACAGKTATIHGIAEFFRPAGHLLHEPYVEMWAHARIVGTTISGRYAVHGAPVQLHLRTVSGAYLDAADRHAVLTHADGVIFVADSQRDKLQQNILELKDLARSITRHGHQFRTFPLVVQYNRRDMVDILPLDILDTYLNPLEWVRFATIATQIPRDDPDTWMSMQTIHALNTLQERIVLLLNAQPKSQLIRGMPPFYSAIPTTRR